MSVRDDGRGNVTPIGIRRPVTEVVLALGGPWHGRLVPMPDGVGSLVAPVPRAPEQVRRDWPWPASGSAPETLTYVVVKMGWHASRRTLRLLVPEKWTQAEAENALVDWIESGGA